MEIKIRHDVYLHDDGSPNGSHNHHQYIEIMELLGTILNAISAMENRMSQEYDALKAQVESNNGLIGSAVTYINGLADQIRDLANEPAKLRELADSMNSSDQLLANAMVANTPAAAGAGSSVNPDGSGRPIPGSTNADGTINP